MDASRVSDANTRNMQTCKHTNIQTCTHANPIMQPAAGSHGRAALFRKVFDRSRRNRYGAGSKSRIDFRDVTHSRERRPIFGRIQQSCRHAISCKPCERERGKYLHLTPPSPLAMWPPWEPASGAFGMHRPVRCGLSQFSREHGGWVPGSGCHRRPPQHGVTVLF